MELADKVVVVTGGASGIGRASAAAFAARRAIVAVWDRDGEQAQEACRQDGYGDRSLALGVDVSDADQVRMACRKTVDELGGIDVMVTAAAIGGYGDLDRVSDRAWRRVLGTDLDGVFWCLREVAPVMRGLGGGRVVLIGSDRGLQPEPGWTPYCVAKAAVIHLARCAALELARDRIHVNVVCPGPTNTNMLSGSGSAILERVSERPLLNRVAQPEEIAETIVYAATHDFTTGAVLLADGGAALVGPFGVRNAAEAEAGVPDLQHR